MPSLTNGEIQKALKRVKRTGKQETLSICAGSMAFRGSRNHEQALTTASNWGTNLE